ncbi:P-loop containing nucleoside triphosphate hydrolases superfamily protein [Raphanus sativus]|nr:P-loop containing nucleoside triphosphate hydrolases superfamily protein [Raphanus sativus]
MKTLLQLYFFTVKSMNQQSSSVVQILCSAKPDASTTYMFSLYQTRKSDQEGEASLMYLQDLHEKHDSWLHPFESGNHGILSVSEPSLEMDNTLHPDIKDRVFYLEGNHMHFSIQKVSALVLDCQLNIDFSRDIETKRH